MHWSWKWLQIQKCVANLVVMEPLKTTSLILSHGWLTQGHHCQCKHAEFITLAHANVCFSSKPEDAFLAWLPPSNTQGSKMHLEPQLRAQAAGRPPRIRHSARLGSVWVRACQQCATVSIRQVPHQHLHPKACAGQ